MSWRTLVDLVPELLIRLDDHLPGPAKLIEVVDIERAEVDSHGVEKVLKPHFLDHALGAIDVNVERRGVGAKDRGHADEAVVGLRGIA